MADKHYYAGDLSVTTSPTHKRPRVRTVNRFDTMQERDAWVNDDRAWRKKLSTMTGEVREAKKMIRMGFTWPIHFW